MTASTTDLAGILDDILAHPADDLPRRAYADWLEEYGDPADQSRMEFIRLQLKAAALQEGSPERTALDKQAETLLNANRAEWEKPLRDLGVTGMIDWNRGFPSGVGIPADNFIANGGQILTTAPITGATVSNLNTGQIATFAASPHLANLTRLNLGQNDIGEAGAQVLAASPHLANLTRLNLGGNGIDDTGARALAASPHLKNLTDLNLSRNQIRNTGARALATSPHLSNLTDLSLWGNGIDDTGAQTLAASTNLGNLTSLNLRQNNIGDTGARALAASTNLSNLTRLNLEDNRIGDAGAAALADSTNLKNLTDLDLWGNEIGDTGAQALAASPHLANLTSLNLEENDVGNNLLNEIRRTIARRGNQTIDPPP